MSDPLTPQQPYEPATPNAAPPAPEPMRAASPAPTGAKKSSGRWLNVLLGVAIVVAVAGVAFAVGRNTAPVQAAGFPVGGNLPGGGGNFPDGGAGLPGGSFDPGQLPVGGTGGDGFVGRGGFGGITIDGTVDAIDATSITVTTADGQQVTISLTEETSYHSQAPASASDVTVGSQVAVELQGGGFPGGANPNGGGQGGTGDGSGPVQFQADASDVTIIP